MENYLVDQETLGQFADKLIATKYPGHPADIYSNLRDQIIADLDDKVSDAIFGGLSREQFDELSALLDQDNDDPSIFEKFFKTHNIDIKSEVIAALSNYEREFLGGQNAK
ncbi:hypothetical protein IKE79_02035 [Candidatus Saccharibacteria bacterium]|nr:hypothetical protein [Candidatus Saccharibacteria bacterium]